MKKIFGAITLSLLAACKTPGTGSIDHPDSNSVSAPNTANDAGLPPDDGGMYGLDERPLNPMCVAGAPPASLSGVKLERVFSNLAFSAPLGLYMAAGDTSRIFAIERAGLVLAFRNEQTETPADVKTVLDLRSKIDPRGEGGFLGMAVHPKWPAQKEIFLSYTETGPSVSIPLRSVIARFTSSDDGQTFDLTSEQRLLVIDQPYRNHNGGNIAFGPDGYLYIGLGDGGSGGDPGNRAQRLNTNLGKFLRIDVDVPFAQKYAIPPSNPFAADATPCQTNTSVAEAATGIRCAEIYAWGVRNPWRWSFDTETGELWAGDVGQGKWEEVDRIVLGGNYGWKTREGAHCFEAATCSTAGLIDPVVEYDRSQGYSITGGFVYHGTKIPSLVGKFVYGDYGSGKVWALNFNAASGAYEGVLLSDTNLSIASFAQLSDGEVYVLSFGTGEIFQLVPSEEVKTDSIAKLLSATGCFQTTKPLVAAAGVIPYDLNAALWSDGAKKHRHFAIPDGTHIDVTTDGDFLFPIGSVLAKTFAIDGRLIETRLFMRHTDGSWAGYSYEWNEDQSDAVLLPAGKSKQVGNQTWAFPSRAQCLQCHTEKTGRVLGPEIAQLNRLFLYPSGRSRNQLETLAGLGFFSAPLAGPATGLDKLEDPFGTGPIDDRSRAYLHANCSGCHRMGMGPDFRFQLSVTQTGTCDVDPQSGNLGIPGAKLLAPGQPAKSIVSRRMHALDANRMPPLGTSVVDSQGTALIDAWITSINSCP